MPKQKKRCFITPDLRPNVDGVYFNYSNKPIKSTSSTKTEKVVKLEGKNKI